MLIYLSWAARLNLPMQHVLTTFGQHIDDSDAIHFHTSSNDVRCLFLVQVLLGTLGIGMAWMLTE